MGAGVLAYAVPATATGKDNGSNKQCVSGRDASNLDWHLNARAGTVTVSARGGKSFCRDVSVVLSIYKVPDTWNGTGFNQTAVPQHKFAPHAMGKLHRKDTLELRVPVPTCGNAQIDLYYPPTQDDVDINGTARFIGGDIFSIGGENGHPASCTPPVETTTPPVETTTPPPVESSSPPVESSSPPPVESSSPPVESSSPPVESSSPPATSPAAVVTVVPTETVPPIAAPIPVLPQSPPRLAETGSNSTIPLLGLGSLLLLAGIGLSLAGRGKPKATPAA
jgi:hypothetical protein